VGLLRLLHREAALVSRAEAAGAGLSFHFGVGRRGLKTFIAVSLRSRESNSTLFLVMFASRSISYWLFVDFDTEEPLAADDKERLFPDVSPAGAEVTGKLLWMVGANGFMVGAD
jgi:hypothetical protein